MAKLHERQPSECFMILPDFCWSPHNKFVMNTGQSKICSTFQIIMSFLQLLQKNNLSEKILRLCWHQQISGVTDQTKYIFRFNFHQILLLIFREVKQIN